LFGADISYIHVIVHGHGNLNINLYYYEYENKKHKVLEASMDRTNISYYDFINLIEGVGFLGIDYLYYRKKNSHAAGAI
jgi:hypothetical protein